MAKKPVIVTLTNPRPCKFDGKDLEIQSELMPPSIKALSECLRNFIGQFTDTSNLEVASEPRIKLALDADHYRGYMIIEVDESARCSDLEIQKFFTYLFDERQAGIFEHANESSEIPPDIECIIREAAESSKSALGGTFLTEEVSVFVGEKKICTVAGKIKRPPPKLPEINRTPKVRRGSISGYCRAERVIYFIEKEARSRVEFNYDPTHLHEVISRISMNVLNWVEIVTQEFSAGNGKVAVTVMSAKEIDKDPSSLF